MSIRFYFDIFIINKLYSIWLKFFYRELIKNKTNSQTYYFNKLSLKFNEIIKIRVKYNHR